MQNAPERGRTRRGDCQITPECDASARNADRIGQGSPRERRSRIDQVITGGHAARGRQREGGAKGGNIRIGDRRGQEVDGTGGGVGNRGVTAQDIIKPGRTGHELNRRSTRPRTDSEI